MSKQLTEQELIERLRASFSEDEVKQLLINDITGTRWFDVNAKAKVHSAGFCYLATEVLYRLMGGSSRWWFKELETDDLPNRWHYFLVEKATNRVVDATADQFGDLPIPYEKARNKGVRFASRNCNRLVRHLGLWPTKEHQVTQ